MNELDKMAKVMMGQHAIHIPFRAVVQEQGEGIVSFIGAIKGEKLRFGSKMVHQLVSGDIILRPHVVAETNHLTGMGLSGIATSSAFFDLREWKTEGNIILDIFGATNEL